jgi:hypothetical protein
MGENIFLKILVLLGIVVCLWFMFLHSPNPNPKGFGQKALETFRFFCLLLTGAAFIVPVLHFGTPIL